MIEFIRKENAALNYLIFNNYTLGKNEYGRYEIYTLTDSNYGNSAWGSIGDELVTPIKFESESAAWNWLSYEIKTTKPKLLKSVIRDMEIYGGQN